MLEFIVESRIFESRIEKIVVRSRVFKNKVTSDIIESVVQQHIEKEAERLIKEKGYKCILSYVAKRVCEDMFEVQCECLPEIKKIHKIIQMIIKYLLYSIKNLLNKPYKQSVCKFF